MAESRVFQKVQDVTAEGIARTVLIGHNKNNGREVTWKILCR